MDHSPVPAVCLSDTVNHPGAVMLDSNLKSKIENFLLKSRWTTTSKNSSLHLRLRIKYLGCRIHWHSIYRDFFQISNTAVVSLCWFSGPQTCNVAKSGPLTLLCMWATVGDHLDSGAETCTWQEPSGCHTSPRRPKPTSSESSKTTDDWGRGRPDLAAIGRVKMYGCSCRGTQTRWDVVMTLCCQS